MKKTILIFLSFLLLVNCSGNSIFDDATKEDEKVTPGIFSRDSKQGLSITDLLSQNKEDNIGLNINAYLWRASINILSIAPLLSTDALGGVIITDWYINKNEPNKRIKITGIKPDKPPDNAPTISNKCALNARVIVHFSPFRGTVDISKIRRITPDKMYNSLIISDTPSIQLLMDNIVIAEPSIAIPTALG